MRAAKERSIRGDRHFRCSCLGDGDANNRNGKVQGGCRLVGEEEVAGGDVSHVGRPSSVSTVSGLGTNVKVKQLGLSQFFSMRSSFSCCSLRGSFLNCNIWPASCHVGSFWNEALWIWALGK